MYYGTSDIIDSLSGKTCTLDWDAVVAYDREKINHLLQQQYVSKLVEGTHFSPIIWENQKKSIRFENLTLGMPLISFEDANTENSRATATLEFIDGDIIEKDSNGQVINYIRIRPGMDLTLKLSIDLIAGEGSVDEDGKVLVNFSQGSITRIDLDLTTEIPADVMEYFTDWLADNTVIYELGQLSFKDLNRHLTPKKFIIRTQCAPEANQLTSDNYGDGAVLLFIATEYNPEGGSLPTDSYPWLIPANHSSTILINNKIVMEHYIKPAFDKKLTTGSWELSRSTDKDAAFCLTGSEDAAIIIDALKLTDNNNYSVWTGTYDSSGDGSIVPKYEDFAYQFKDSSIVFDTDLMRLQFDKDASFKSNISGSYSNCTPVGCPTIADKVSADFFMSGGLSYEANVNDNKLINFKLIKNNITLTSDMRSKLKEEFSSVSEKFLNELFTILSDNTEMLITNLQFNDIDVFAVDRVLFPENNINRLESVYMPGDLVIFGNIDPALTRLTLTPLTTTVAVGDTMAFDINTDEAITYTIFPKDAGSISDDGEYYAPESINGSALNVKVTATTTSETSASAYITVISSPILISPSFAVLEEDNLHDIQFNASVLGDDRTLTEWTLTSSSPDVVGTITQDGLYTPPEDGEEYPLGYTFVTVTATTSDEKSAKAYIMLISSKTHAEFKVIPSFASISAEMVRQLTAKETLDFKPNTWSCYPELGKLSKPEENEGIYSVNYTAPDEVSGDDLVIIRAIEKNRESRAGYSLINLSSKTPEPWQLINGVSTLKVVNEAGGGTAKFYKNSAQQVMIRVKLAGYRLINNKPEYVPLTLEDILPHLKLVDYVTGEPLDWKTGDDWYYTTVPNQFKRLPVGLEVNNPANIQENTDTFTFYVSCNQDAQSSSKRIAVRLTLADGTVISSAANGFAGFDSSVSLDAVPGIDYSLIKNISVVQNSRKVIQNKVSWESHNLQTNEYETLDEPCKITATDFIISPADESIATFHSFTIEQEKIINHDVSKYFLNWKSAFERIFHCLDDHAGMQCAVLGKHDDDDIDGSANLWFFGGLAELTDGNICFAENEENVIYRVEMPEIDYGEERKTLPYFTLLKLSTPEKIKPYKWETVVHPLTLNLTDIYGNTGKLDVFWDEEENYDKPNIA